MRASARAIAALFAASAVMASTGCGGTDSFRIGVLTDCQGPLRGFEDVELSGAELPLLRRGALLLDGAPTNGVGDVDVAGHNVELVRGCSEVGEHTVYIEEARRLVEREHVDAVVGGASVVAREVARLYPEVPFLATGWEEQDVTLRRPAANLFRFGPDFGQQAAGLGAYAYEQLGWRRATVLGGDEPAGWGGAAGFVAEFCALGGRIDREIFRPPDERAEPAGVIAARAVAPGSDGVVAFLTVIDDPAHVVRALVGRLDDPPRRLLLWAQLAEDYEFKQQLGARLEGITTTARYRAGPPPASLAAYQKAYRAAFPRIPPGFELVSLVIDYTDAIEALLTSLERADGDLSNGRRRLRDELAHGRFLLPRGEVALDGNRQVVADTPLVRLRWSEKAVTTEPVSVAHDVEQTFGGLLADAPPPGPRSQPCRRARPPAWAR